MAHPFDEYGKTVCSYVKHATPDEKDWICKELSDHMEDHAAALAAAGYDEDHARRTAVESMGSAEDVGKALNKEYPLRWLILARAALILLLLSVYWVVPQVYYSVEYLHSYYQAKYEPIQCDRYLPQRDLKDSLVPMDFQKEFPGGSTLSIYATSLKKHPNGSYTAYVCAVSYSKSPVVTAMDFSQNLTFTWDADTCDYYRPSSGGSYNVFNYSIYQLNNFPEGENPTAHYDSYGTVFDVEIPLPWEEVSSQ